MRYLYISNLVLEQNQDGLPWLQLQSAEFQLPFLEHRYLSELHRDPCCAWHSRETEQSWQNTSRLLGMMTARKLIMTSQTGLLAQSTVSLALNHTYKHPDQNSNFLKGYARSR